MIVAPGSTGRNSSRAGAPRSLGAVTRFFHGRISPLFGGGCSTCRSSIAKHFASPSKSISLLVMGSGLLAKFSTPVTTILCISGGLRSRALLRTVTHIGHICASGSFNLIISCVNVFGGLGSTLSLCDSRRSNVGLFSHARVRSTVTAVGSRGAGLRTLCRRL